MVRSSEFYCLVFVSCLYLSTIGCGDPTAAVYPAEGRVTLDGQPIAGVSISLLPEDGVQGRGGFAVSDDSGTFKLMSFDGQEGVPEGKYKVLFQKFELPDGSPIPDGQSAADLGAVNILPDAYVNPLQCTTFATIAAGDNPPMEFDLDSKRKS